MDYSQTTHTFAGFVGTKCSQKWVWRKEEGFFFKINSPNRFQVYQLKSSIEFEVHIYSSKRGVVK